LLKLCQTLEGRVPAHQRFLISSILSHMDYLEMTIQNVQMSIERCILPSEETADQLNIVPAANQIDSNIVFSGISIDIDRLLYKQPPAPWVGIRPGNRKSSCKRPSSNTTRRVILRELAQTLTQEKDTFLSAMCDHQVGRQGKKRALAALAHEFLVISYHILQNNKPKPRQELALNYYEQLDAMRLEQRRGYRFGQLVINCCISICLMAALALISHSPFVFPSLGPTVFLFFYKPTDPSASPRNILMGHAIATIVGYFSLVVTGLTAAGPAFAVGVTWPRIIAIGLSLGLTVGLMVLFRAPHPPAAATTLIISLGTLTKPWQLLVLMLAVVVLTLQALIINRLAGIDYPLWRSQPAQRASP
jgi:CBS domain-containing membrane protein